jgi:hypothetical protein
MMQQHKLLYYWAPCQVLLSQNSTNASTCVHWQSRKKRTYLRVPTSKSFQTAVQEPKKLGLFFKHEQ